MANKADKGGENPLVKQLLGSLTTVGKTAEKVVSPKDWEEVRHPAGEGLYARFPLFPLNAVGTLFLIISVHVREYVQKAVEEGKEVVKNRVFRPNFGDCEFWQASGVDECHKDGTGVMLSGGRYRTQNSEGRWYATNRGGLALSANGAQVFLSFPGAYEAFEKVGISKELLDEAIQRQQEAAAERRLQRARRPQAQQAAGGPQTQHQRIQYSGPAGSDATDEGEIDVPA